MFIPVVEKNKKDDKIKQDFLGNKFDNLDNFDMKNVRIMSITDLKNNKTLKECFKVSFKEEKEIKSEKGFFLLKSNTNWRRGRDSNPRGAKPPADFESVPLSLFGTSPITLNSLF